MLHHYREVVHSPDLETLEDLLLSTLHGFSHVYLVLDALDECPFDGGARGSLMDALLRLRGRDQASLHLFITSRREFDIKVPLQPTFLRFSETSSVFDLDLSNFQDSLNHDIGLFIDDTFVRRPFRSWPIELKEEAKLVLIKNSDGMYVFQ